MEVSLRRLGQLLVVTGALLGAVLGVALALIVENAETSRAVAAPRPEGAAVLAASPPSSQASTSRTASTGDQADNSDSSGNERARSAERPDQHAGKANQSGEGRGDTPSKGKGKPRKGKNK